MTPADAPVSKAGPDVTIMAVVTAVGTALAALQLFQPKFAIGQAMKREVGRLEPGYLLFYKLAQIISAVFVFLVWAVLSLAAVHQIAPTVVPRFKLLDAVIGLLALQNLIPVLLLAVVLGGVVQLNIVSWIFLWLGRFVAMLPIPGLKGAFGQEGRSAGWHQAWLLCRTWDKGQPLLISQDNVARLADTLVFKLANSRAQQEDFAKRPNGASNFAAANLAVIGGIVEASHRVNRWRAPTSWTKFYAALEAIHADKNIFEPATVVRFSTGANFSEEVRKLLAAQMFAQGEDVPDGNYFAVASSIAKAWEILKDHGGSALGMLPLYSGGFGSKIYWLKRRLSKFPLLHDGGMRNQVIKLMARWETAPWIKESDFLHPFSATQAWLLLQESALTVLPEQKDVTFWTESDVAISRLACQRIYAHTEATVREGLSPEAKDVAAKYRDRWDLMAAADFALWAWARSEFRRASADDWQSTKGWRWRLSNGRASKIG